MNDSEFNRSVVVTAQHGEKYFGYVPKDIADRGLYFGYHQKEGLPIALENVRLLVMQYTQKQSGGMQSFMGLLPIDLFSTSMDKFYVAPSMWYFPSENPSIRGKLEKLIEAAERNDQMNKAMEAGIHIPGKE